VYVGLSTGTGSAGERGVGVELNSSCYYRDRMVWTKKRRRDAGRSGWWRSCWGSMALLTEHLEFTG